MFFATYGSFMHTVLQLYLSGQLSQAEAIDFFLQNYDDKVRGDAPSEKVAQGFFNKSFDYLQEIDFPYKDIVATEKQVHFEIDGFKFIGFIDVLAKTGKQYHIIDHKSHGLRNRSGRRFQTQYDKQLDRYLRQQYLYSIPIKQEYGRFPATLNFNCYRHGRFIKQKFDPQVLHRTKLWAVQQIHTIRDERSWDPTPDQFRCNYICDSSQSCEYCKKFYRRGRVK